MDIMSRFNNTDILTFRRFDRIDGTTHSVYHIAWPVEAVECYANQVAEGKLDVLTEAVLQMLAIPGQSRKDIARSLFVGSEVVETIIKALEAQGYYDPIEKKLTQSGNAYLERGETEEFSDNKVFGCMFVSRIDGEIFPYFHEGRLPIAHRSLYDEDLYYLSFDQETPSTLKTQHNNIQDKINRAYYKYGKITRGSQEMHDANPNAKDIEFIDSEMVDRNFDEEGEPETFADVQAQRLLNNARIKLLKTEPRCIYIHSRICVSKAEPEKFIIDSPFEENITNWYSDCFQRMRANNELIYLSGDNDSERGLDFFCDEVTQGFYTDFPELQKENFNQFIKINYPSMNTCSIKNECITEYKKIFNYMNFCASGSVKTNTVIAESAIAIELILNNYVARTDRGKTRRDYKNYINYGGSIDDIFYSFGIKDCAGLDVEKSFLDKRPGNHPNSTILKYFNPSKINGFGRSIPQKYTYLIADAYFNSKESRFGKLLRTEGGSIIDDIDSFYGARSKFGAHVDDITIKDISMSEYQQLMELFKTITNTLLKYFD